MAGAGNKEGGAQLTRHCIHYRERVPGGYYSGAQYIEALKRLRASAAVRAASKVEPLFWADAYKAVVWLCEECANEMMLPAGAREETGELVS